MTDYIQIIIFSLMIVFLHELGHYIVLKGLKIPIYHSGVAFRPIPHYYIRYKWPKSITKHCLIMFSGSLTTIIGFVVFYMFFNHSIMKLVYVAYYIQFIFETNPFFSDFVFASVICKNKITDFRLGEKDNFRSQIKTYMFSYTWYIHFILWVVLTVLSINQISLQMFNN